MHAAAYNLAKLYFIFLDLQIRDRYAWFTWAHSALSL